jgi:hypothetical protein
VAKPELGAKRQCQSCGAKFFDFHKEPVVCPKCGAVFHVPARAAPLASEEENELEKDAVEVPLEEAEAPEKTEAIVDEDIEIEGEGEDDTFLEEEEDEDDDVSGLIDSDLDTDEET